MANTDSVRYLRIVEHLVRMWLVLLAFIISLAFLYTGMAVGRVVVILSTPVTYGNAGTSTYSTDAWTGTKYRHLEVRLGTESRTLDLLLHEPVISEGDRIPVRVVGEEGIRYASFSELYELKRLLYLVVFVLPPAILTFWALNRYKSMFPNLDWLWLRVITFGISLPLALIFACSVIDDEWNTPFRRIAAIVVLVIGARYLYARTKRPIGAPS